MESADVLCINKNAHEKKLRKKMRIDCGFVGGTATQDGARGDELLEADVHVACEVLEGELRVGARERRKGKACYDRIREANIIIGGIVWPL